MKSIVRYSTLLLIFAMVLIPALSVRAADQPCFGLQKADCDLFYAAFNSNAMAKVTSANFAFKLALDTKVDKDPAGTGKFNVEGTGLLGEDKAAKDPTAKALFQLAIKAAVSGMGQAKAQDFAAELRAVNGSLFIGVGPQWMELSLAEAATSAEGMAGMVTGSSGMPTNAVSDPAAYEALLKALNTPGVVKAEVKDGAAVDGKATREYTHTIDVVALFKSKDFAPLLEEIKKSDSSASFDPKQLEAFKDLKVVLVTAVGKDDKMVYKVGLKANASWDAAGAKTLEAKGAGSVAFDFSFNLSKINQAVKVDKPANAKKTDINELLGQLMGGMGAPK